MSAETIRVLVAEPAKPCEVREISPDLRTLQGIVGGGIEMASPFMDPAAIICNAEGKNLDLPPNRMLCGSQGTPYDVLCGTFLIVGVSGEDFASLTEDQIRQYKDLYDRMIIPAEKETGAPVNGRTAVNTSGVLTFPNNAGGRQIRFIDSCYNPLFRVPDGGNIVLTAFNGDQKILPCRYLDDYHARIGGETFHICEFAETQERRGAIYAPEHPGEGDICDTYTIYQIKDARAVSYAYMPYAQAQGKLRAVHYQRAYQGVLAPKVTLEDLFGKHNRDSRPFGQRMRSLSMSDVIVLNRGGEEKAFYVDRVGFQEAKQFLNPPVRKRKPPCQER